MLSLAECENTGYKDLFLFSRWQRVNSTDWPQRALSSNPNSINLGFVQFFVSDPLWLCFIICEPRSMKDCREDSGKHIRAPRLWNTVVTHKHGFLPSHAF